jgi:hypothetical protein
MFSTLTHFAAMHFKTIISLAFLAGAIKCVDLIVKIVDLRLPDEKKSKFGVWVGKLGPRIDALTANVMFGWAKKHRAKSFLIYCAIYHVRTIKRISGPQ